jgi:hypothetical protein
MLWQHLREVLVDAQFESDPAGNLVRVPGQHCHTHALLFEQRDRFTALRTYDIGQRKSSHDTPLLHQVDNGLASFAPDLCLVGELLWHPHFLLFEQARATDL